MTTNITALYGLNQFTGQWKSQVFTSSGTWTRPDGVEVIRVMAVGGGGGGSAYYYYDYQMTTINSVATVPTVGLNTVVQGDFAVTARGGEPAKGNWGGNGGGVGTGITTGVVSPSSRITNLPNRTSITETNFIQYASSIPIGNGGLYQYMVSDSMNLLFPEYYPGHPLYFLTPGGLGYSSPYGSTGGGGGASSTPGGNAVGYGSGGSISGGGGSFGNGGTYLGASGTKRGSDGTYGGGGGGMPNGNGDYSTDTSRIQGGGGGGGGEIVMREIPVVSSPTVSVTIGEGGTEGTYRIISTSTTLYAGKGGKGIAIVYWQE
jgi:hypothetical protein